MEHLIAATFFVVLSVNGVPVHHLEEQMTVGDCLDEMRRFMLRHHEYKDGAKATAGCTIDIPPSINH